MKPEQKLSSETSTSENSITSIGICVGASTISIVELEADKGADGKPQNIRVAEHESHPHEGDPKHTLSTIVERKYLSSFDNIAVTGRKFCDFVNLTSVSEPESVEYAYQFAKPEGVDSPAVVSAGGETFMVYVLDKKGKISNVITGNKCASGTGEFFLQQLRRMNVSLDDAVQFASTEEPHHVSGRCSVFCKSDCTHATNAGIPKSQVTAGLCHMMAGKVMELLNKVEHDNTMIVGGVTKNRMMIDYLHEDIKGLVVPKEASYFEALGAALWAFDNPTDPFPGHDSFINHDVSSFGMLPPLRDFESQVEFKTLKKDDVKDGDNCIIGLDVGSTTTKAVLIRREDKALLASVYLRTNGDPVGAFRECYKSILEQIESSVASEKIAISGLGVSGSGRQIAGLHAMTDGIINEIIAHATAAVHFDPEVDTLFEIGGQDAKYTYIRNSVPSDYAMNEACSAGTGSFLEESALETLGIEMEDIADVALAAKEAPNFNDQCAAFISSDIKNAIHEGIERKEIVSGLVYSVCMNYANRVKGNRPVGKKIFMQGGVCYNKAVPLAMASLVGRPIIVPPEPGLMGAFGVALEVDKRLDAGLLEEKFFNLKELIGRDVTYGKKFHCNGSKENCDRNCEITMIELEGKKYPFGGACNKYYNLRKSININVNELDLVSMRQHLVYDKYGHLTDKKNLSGKPVVAINRSFLVNTYFPLYSTFFTELGFECVMPEKPTQEGIDQKNAAFCYPVELAHGFFDALTKSEVTAKYIFLPHFRSVPTTLDHKTSQVCPFVQGETFYLQTAFKKQIAQLKSNGTELLTPLIDLTEGIDEINNTFKELGKKLGIADTVVQSATAKAIAAQNDCVKEMQEIGKKTVAELEKTPQRIAVSIFSRPYNGFVEEAHMGIPHKIASRGVLTLPFDFLPAAEESFNNMYWGLGQRILSAAKYVNQHPQLFGAFITNFSCGPDSFLITFFRDIMKQKPSLTLELDSHTADAGLETRIEAFLDIVSSYRQLLDSKAIENSRSQFKSAKTVLENEKLFVVNSSGEKLPISDRRVKLLIPSMGYLSSEGLAAVMRSASIHAIPAPIPNEEILKVGRANSTCKECLPLIITTGTLMEFIHNQKKDDEVLVYFMPTASGPCRFGQYSIYMQNLINKQQIKDVAIFSLSSEDSYAGMSGDFQKRAWWATLISDVMEDMRSMLLVNAVDKEHALQVFESEWQNILQSLEKDSFSGLKKSLKKAAASAANIKQKIPQKEVPKILLAGEIFVRRESLSRQYLTEKLAEKGFATICSPISEWILYSDYLLDKGLSEEKLSGLQMIGHHIKKKFMSYYEGKIKKIISSAGIIESHKLDIKKIMQDGEKFISPELTGEAILTVGSAIHEAATETCGVIAIGPFGCMPNRVAESVLNVSMTRENKLATEPQNSKLKAVLKDIEELPFLAIESDGSPFPQLINAKLDTFLLRANRLHSSMQK
ncbi:MAG: activase [Gammaproteobacteria bacterium]|nr:MAG: activase [Gammaproteobacteria bacterium]